MAPLAAWILLRIQDHDPNQTHFEPFLAAPVSSQEVFQLSENNPSSDGPKPSD